ncbi:MAG TPA: SRPBCC family protein [Stellaceae bacterium]
MRRRRASRRQGDQQWFPGTATHAYAERLARGLGWFSIGLGLAEVMAPRAFGRLIGVFDHAGLLRTIGLREIASGIGALTERNPAPAIWSRVAGDAMDLSLLGLALTSPNKNRDRVAAATAAVAGIAALDTFCAQKLTESDEPTPARALLGAPIHVIKAVTINRKPEEVYSFWHNFENLPRFMSHLWEVRVIDDRRSHWRARAPAGMTVEWDSEITEDKPNERISWRSLEGADVENSGTVRFEPGPRGRGTEVHVEIRYTPPGGRLGAMIAMLFGEEPSQQMREDLRNLKRVMETGEIIRSEASLGRIAHAARPPGRLPAR